MSVRQWLAIRFPNHLDMSVSELSDAERVRALWIGGPVKSVIDRVIRDSRNKWTVTITLRPTAARLRYANAIGRRCTSRLDSSDIIYRTLIRTIERLRLRRFPAVPSSLTKRTRVARDGLGLPSQLPQSAIAIHHAMFTARFHIEEEILPFSSSFLSSLQLFLVRSQTAWLQKQIGYCYCTS